MSYEKLIELHKIVAWRGGCVYRTESLGERWVPIDDEAPAGFQYVSLSTTKAKAMADAGEQTFRKARPGS